MKIYVFSQSDWSDFISAEFRLIFSKNMGHYSYD